MKCPNVEQLKRFLSGELEPGELVAVDEHVRSCGECRAALDGMPESKRFGAQIGSELLGVGDCPEYEELSAYVDGELEPDRVSAVTSHINLCEPCWNDTRRLSELRSHAAMREKVTMRPGMSAARRSGTWFPMWKRVLAGVSLAAVSAVPRFLDETALASSQFRRGNTHVGQCRASLRAASFHQVAESPEKAPPHLHRVPAILQAHL